jgi:hypothetical protein
MTHFRRRSTLLACGRSCSDCSFYSCSPQSLRRHCCHTAKSAETEIPRAAVEELFSDVGKETNHVGHLSGSVKQAQHRRSGTSTDWSELSRINAEG